MLPIYRANQPTYTDALVKGGSNFPVQLCLVCQFSLK